VLAPPSLGNQPQEVDQFEVERASMRQVRTKCLLAFGSGRRATCQTETEQGEAGGFGDRLEKPANLA
jgi:hypothetical protein